jgi:hypothetical protein
MGFSLETFFMSLESIIDSCEEYKKEYPGRHDDALEAEAYRELVEEIKNSAKYAEECGLIPVKPDIEEEQ